MLLTGCDVAERPTYSGIGRASARSSASPAPIANFAGQHQAIVSILLDVAVGDAASHKPTAGVCTDDH